MPSFCRHSSSLPLYSRLNLTRLQLSDCSIDHDRNTYRTTLKPVAMTRTLWATRCKLGEELIGETDLGILEVNGGRDVGQPRIGV